jgi:hypothetical protein
VGTLLAALFADGDTAQARIALAHLQRSDLTVPELCVLAIVQIARQDLPAVQSMAARLRAEARAGGNTLGGATAQVCDAVVAALTAEAGAAPQLLGRADSIIRTGPPLPPELRNAANLALARAWESIGDQARARDAARRWDHVGAVTVFPMLAEQGRLAALLGDTAEAVWAWDRYLKTRGKAEPEQRARDDLIREQLSRLVGEKN